MQIPEHFSHLWGFSHNHHTQLHSPSLKCAPHLVPNTRFRTRFRSHPAPSRSKARANHLQQSPAFFPRRRLRIVPPIRIRQQRHPILLMNRFHREPGRIRRYPLKRQRKLHPMWKEKKKPFHLRVRDEKATRIPRIHLVFLLQKRTSRRLPDLFETALDRQRFNRGSRCSSLIAPRAHAPPDHKPTDREKTERLCIATHTNPRSPEQNHNSTHPTHLQAHKSAAILPSSPP